MPDNHVEYHDNVNEILAKLEKEFYCLNEWFGRYDQLIWCCRSLLITIYVAVMVFSVNVLSQAKNAFIILTLFSLYFLAMEIFWLKRYWAKRTARYQQIQDVVHLGEESSIKKMPLMNMDLRLSPEIKKASIFKKIDEPLFFYFGLIFLSGIVLGLLT